MVYTFTQRSSVNDYFFGARVNPVNPDYLDMTLEANAEGWVGIGFSLNAMMVCLLVHTLFYHMYSSFSISLNEIIF